MIEEINMALLAKVPSMNMLMESEYSGMRHSTTKAQMHLETGNLQMRQLKQGEIEERRKEP